MQNQKDKRFSAQNICKALMAARLISREQAQDLLKKESRVRTILLEQKIKGKENELSQEQQVGLISFIDVVFSGVRLGNCMEKYEKSLFFT